MMEYENEPVRGLPGELPDGESILWQGAPDWRVFLRSALHSRWIALYFVALAVISFASGSVGGAVASLIGGAGTIGLLAIFAVLVARTTVYTITNRRIVLRIGVALNACVNLPLKQIGSAHLRAQQGDTGDIALELVGRHGLGYAMLWPHARPWRVSPVQPMLRAVPDAKAVAVLLGKACARVAPNVRSELDAEPARAPAAAGWEEAAA